MKNNKFIIAKRKETDKLANKREFRGNKIEAGGTHEECLKREIKEKF